jgi:hypothetical protein
VMFEEKTFVLCIGYNAQMNPVIQLSNKGQCGSSHWDSKVIGTVKSLEQ